MIPSPSSTISSAVVRMILMACCPEYISSAERVVSVVMSAQYTWAPLFCQPSTAYDLVRVSTDSHLPSSKEPLRTRFPLSAFCCLIQYGIARDRYLTRQANGFPDCQSAGRNSSAPAIMTNQIIMKPGFFILFNAKYDVNIPNIF